METPKPRTYELYNHMANEHGLTLLDSELNEIEIIVDRMLAADREHETAHGSSSELGAVSWLECVARSAERTRHKYADLHNEASGLEQIIYGEICDAFQEFTDSLRAGAEEHSNDGSERSQEAE